MGRLYSVYLVLLTSEISMLLLTSLVNRTQLENLKENDFWV